MNEIAHPSIHSIKARRVPSLIDISDGPSPSSFNTKRSVDPPYSTPRSSLLNRWNYGSCPQSNTNKIKAYTRPNDSLSMLWQSHVRQIDSGLNSNSLMYSPCKNVPMQIPLQVNRIKALTLKNRALPTHFPPGDTEQINPSVSNINTRPAEHTNQFTTPPGSGTPQLRTMEANSTCTHSSDVTASIQKKNPNQFNQLLHYEIQ